MNSATRIISDSYGDFHFTYSSDSSVFYAYFIDGNLSSSNEISSYCLSSIWRDNQNIHILTAGISGVGEPPFNNDTTYSILWIKYENDISKSKYLYSTNNKILSISFAIDPLDTGWVLFNVLEDGINKLKIGKFYTQIEFDTLKNVITLDEYTGEGLGKLDVRNSDRSLHVVYEKDENVMYLKRDNQGNWSSPFRISRGHNPSISVAGELIHFVWERWYASYNRIQTCYTDGEKWSRIQEIATNYDIGCFPYIHQGCVITWQQRENKQWEVYSSRRTLNGSWAAPQNISNTDANSKYPQVAMYQTPNQTYFTYLWTEGNSSPFEIKIKRISYASPDLSPLYAFDVGEKEPSIFNERRTGYILYGNGFEKSVDYDTTCLKYRIKGLNPEKIYLLYLVFYQDETDEYWNEEIIIDGILLKTVNLRRKKLVIERILIPPEVYRDGVFDLNIKRKYGPKSVLSAFALLEFIWRKENLLSKKGEDKEIYTEFESFNSKNLFHKKVKFSYYLYEPDKVRIKIYSVCGKLLYETESKKSPGIHIFTWNGKDKNSNPLPSGIYFIKIETTNWKKVKKIILFP